MQKYSKCFGEGQNFLSLFHVSGNFKRKIFEIFFGMTKIDRHFLLPNVVICFTLYTREIAINHLSYFVACKCVIYFRVPYLDGTRINGHECKLFDPSVHTTKHAQAYMRRRPWLCISKTPTPTPAAMTSKGRLFNYVYYNKPMSS